ncbi:MAG: acetylxylan esterase [Candidatus Latescibacteria bacterium]|nr:acetylxylan esterase [Candidatus Latescibacterota bacterium]
MVSKILDSSRLKPLQPATSLWQQYQPGTAPRAFTAANVAQARRWQKSTRGALAKHLCLSSDASTPLAPRLVEEVDKGDYTRQKIVLRTGPQAQMPVYLLIPKGAQGPLPAVVAFHGHGYGVKDIVGLWEDGGERDEPDGYHKDFAVALCRAGFAVAAPEISGFGERQTDFSYLERGQGAPSSCTHMAMLAFHLGTSVVGIRVNDGLRLVDYLQTRPEFDTDRLGAMGISGGGMQTFFSACIDERIRACVVSGYYSTFQHSILAMSHCPCNFVPGLAQFGEMYDLVGLIAPRPMLVEAGTHDPIFPIKAVRASLTKARRIYSLFDARPQVEADIFSGRHQISGARAYDFLREKLNA